ncbi:uncharacterized protein LOC118696813 isoform X1 [Molothrus ater]|uniref:uncharacterized protein LOC118696813 isoform X1 n=1 Tax=Molothrus ater TaxID=84834 RepID=UPI0023E8C226|nr:uncharacterized protein LOC118696813 isoform X1 [Molothrus ater]
MTVLRGAPATQGTPCWRCGAPAQPPVSAARGRFSSPAAAAAWRAEPRLPHRTLPLQSCWMARLCRLLQPRTSRRSLPRPQPRPRSRSPSSAASRTPRPARCHDDCPRRRSDGTHACAVATTPAPAISLRADSSNHSAASGISRTHAQFYLHGPAATPHCVCRSFGTARSRFRAAACRCPATAGIPVPCHATSAATASIHGTTAGENCSALRVSFRVSPSAGHREIPLQRVTLSNRYLVCLCVFAFHTPSTQWDYFVSRFICTATSMHTNRARRRRRRRRLEYDSCFNKYRTDRELFCSCKCHPFDPNTKEFRKRTVPK